MGIVATEEAVSPVIGTILMVAITVILAAVIAAFTFGMVGTSFQVNKPIGATVQQSIPDIIITFNGGPDKNSVDCIKSNIKDTGIIDIIGTCDSNIDDMHAGLSYRAIGQGTADPDHVIVIAVYVDGTQQVIADTYV